MVRLIVNEGWWLRNNFFMLWDCPENEKCLGFDRMIKMFISRLKIFPDFFYIFLFK
jgi:hypothetical protein